MDYGEFLASKIKLAEMEGIDIDASEVATHITVAGELVPLKPHQRDIIAWAVRGGRRAIFEAFGLGKTIQQLEVLRIILKHKGGSALVVAPLGVRQEFRKDAEKLGLEIRFIRRNDEMDGDGIYLTNYESVRDGKLRVGGFTAVSLDEASVLRGYGTKTYQTFLPLFRDVPYRFVATATPSPNRYKELIHYGGFLGIMDTGQALTRFFQRDSQKANNLTLYPHKEQEFYLWLNSWAIFLQKPSDLGYPDDGYTMPAMDIRWHVVKADIADAGIDNFGQHRLIRDAAIGLKEAAKEKRDTLPARIEKMQEIIAADPESHFLIWHDLEAERHAIKTALPEARAIYGSQDQDLNEAITVGFSEGEFKYLATKPQMSGSGPNFQRHCHKAIFLGVGFKFNDFIQAIHRIYRFLQDRQVEIHIIHAETETEVVRTLKAKWKQDEELRVQMSDIIREHGLAHLGGVDELTRSIGCHRIAVESDLFTMVNSDCVEEARRMETESVDLLVTSIPFSNHYEYTPSYNDFGHTDNDDHFFAQMDFLTTEVIRVLKPGRLACIHTKDRIRFGNVTGEGVPTVNPFHCSTIMHYLKHGFQYMGMITVVTDVVRENNQTYRLGWTENCKDGTKMGVGSPEYIILMRKPQTDTTRGYADVPVVKSKEDYSRAAWQVDAHAFWRSSGDRLVKVEELSAMQPGDLGKAFTKWTLEDVYSHADHVAIGEALEARGALPATFMSIAPGSHDEAVWHDVQRMLTLNGQQSARNVEKHICPLQFDIVDRLIVRYSNPGELVYDPFGGLGTVPVRAMKLGRRGYASELNPDYFKDAVGYCRATENEIKVPSLFDLIDAEAA